MKKVKFGNLKQGQKFRFKRKLCIKDSMYCTVRLSNGTIESVSNNDLVTPVKVKITIQ
jgi:hypothetical protein